MSAASVMAGAFAFASSRVRVLLLECTARFLQTAGWSVTILPGLQQTCMVDSVTLSATQVGIPSTKRRTFVVEIRRVPNGKHKLAVRRQRLQQYWGGSTATLGEFLRKRGADFLKRAPGKRVVHPFDDLIDPIAQSHGSGQKPVERYRAHASDGSGHRRHAGATVRRLLQDHHGTENSHVPDNGHLRPTVSESGTAAILEQLSLPVILRAAISDLQALKLPAVEGGRRGDRWDSE